MSAQRAAPACLLGADEPAAITVERQDGASEFVLACDHAGCAIPRSLGTLGLSDRELASHIAWDIGTVGVALRLSERLDASLVLQNYSRLVIDCNRPLEAPDSIATTSEWTQISGNDGLSAAAIEARVSEVFQPYHDGLRQLLDERQRHHRKTILVAVHSFTPAFRGESRPWHIGVMYHHDARLAAALIKLLKRDERLVVGDNEPYAVDDATDYTLPIHGEARRIPHVGLEIRQDLIADEAGQKTWAGRLANLLKQAAEMVTAAETA
jgi:predicted N-formylglutamate amidohydrolase